MSATGSRQPRCFWFRIKRSAWGGKIVDGAGWVYCQVFETSGIRAARAAKTRLREAIGHQDTGVAWGGCIKFEDVPGELIGKLGRELLPFEHPRAGVVFMRGMV